MSKLKAMTEFELKFEVPSACLKSVATAVLQGKVIRQRLQASYFDTVDGALAMRGIVLRMRKEGRRWVQTAKGPTADLLERMEHNVALLSQGKGVVPIPDLSRHRGTPVGKAIAKALGRKNDALFPGLVVVYSTDIHRSTRCVVHGGSTVEVALDQGRVFADGRSQAICELEFELKNGTPLDVVALARQWCTGHKLWLSSITKSMKGQRLRSAAAFGAAVLADAPKFSRQATGEEMMTAVVQSCLRQILPNASELASGSNDSNHVHQFRVGIRRLRTALRELGGLTGAIQPEWETVLVQVFRALGRHRDHTHQALFLQPQLLAAGGPVVHLNDTGDSIPDPGETARAPDFQSVLLDLAGFVHRGTQQGAPNNGAVPGELKKTLSVRLEKLHSRALRDGKKFLALDEEQQHAVRKRLKRLRYLLEFVAPLFVARKVNGMTAALKPAQDALGLYNDELMALRAWRALATEDCNAWFGIGWFTARQQPNAGCCLMEIKVFAAIKPFWRG